MRRVVAQGHADRGRALSARRWVELDWDRERSAWTDCDGLRMEERQEGEVIHISARHSYRVDDQRARTCVVYRERQVLRVVRSLIAHG